MQTVEQTPLTSSSATNAVINVVNLSKRYAKTLAVNDVSLTVAPGDIFGLLGPNGAGKTTLIRMLLGMIEPSAGQVKVFGFDPMKQRAAVLQRVSAIIEAPALYPNMSGRDNMRAIAKLIGLHDEKRIDWALETMGLLGRAKDTYRTYSLGMKQRLCIAAALLSDPQLIILDEPTNGLDPAGMSEIRELMRDLAQQGRTILLCSHLLNEVQQVCNRVAIVKKGQVIVQGSVNELLADQMAIQVKVAPTKRERAIQILKSSGWGSQLSEEGDYLIIENPGSDGAAINEALATQQIFASEVSPRQQSLEEYYLKLTGE